LALDFDNTIVEADEPLRFKLGALAAIAAFKRAGHKLILFSARCTPPSGPLIDDEVSLFYESGVVQPHVLDQWARFEEMRAFLQARGVWGVFDDVWQEPGKPHVDRFIDDLFEAPNWGSLALELGAPDLKEKT
jgi:hypothetical protein